jgi:transposase-like protein
MGRPSKFTAENRQKVIEALQVGASRNEAARIAKIGPTTLKRWLEEAKSASEGSAKAKFRDDVEEAEAHPKMRALGVVYRALEDRPDLAWKFIERRVEGYQPPIQAPVAAFAGPVSITLSFNEVERPTLSEVIDVGPADPTPSKPSELPARASRKPTRGRKGS